MGSQDPGEPLTPHARTLSPLEVRGSRLEIFLYIFLFLFFLAFPFLALLPGLGFLGPERESGISWPAQQAGRAGSGTAWYSGCS